MFWLVALLLAGQEPAVRPEPVWQLPSPSDMERCARRAGDQSAYDVILVCAVNEQGRPTDCEPHGGRTPPTPRALNAARCMARSYRLTNPEARQADGRVMLRIVAFPG